VSDSYRKARLDRVRATQNADGGWGYFAGRHSWLEPTCYALLALQSETDRESKAAFARGWNLMRSWQLPEGGWRPAEIVPAASWVSALCVLLHQLQGVDDGSYAKGLAWLVGMRGSEGSLFERAVNLVKRLPVEYDRRWKGWPWSPDASSWVEPTALSLLALKKAQARRAAANIGERILEGERMLIDRRCGDGGWNYGNRRVLETELPSYPETTAVALVGLQSCRLIPLESAVAVGVRQHRETQSRLAKAWLSVALQVHARDPAPAAGETPLSREVIVTALEAIAARQGGVECLRV